MLKRRVSQVRSSAYLCGFPARRVAYPLAVGLAALAPASPLRRHEHDARTRGYRLRDRR